MLDVGVSADDARDIAAYLDTRPDVSPVTAPAGHRLQDRA